MQRRYSALLDILSSSLTLRRLEWVGILAPLAFLGPYFLLVLGPAHIFFHSLPGFVVLFGLLGLLVTAFSRLIFRVIVRLHRDVEELSRVAASRSTQLRALNDANLALSQERLVPSVLQQVVDLSRELVQARYAALAVLGDNREIKSFFTSGVDQETRRAIGPLPLGKGLLGLILERAEPLRLNDLAAHPTSVGFPPGHPLMTTFLGTPIRYKGQAVGSLYLTEKVGGIPFSEGDEEVVQLFANQAAVAVQNARLYDQIQALAVETERTRLSHEMHDGLAQVLGYVNTKAQAVEAYLSKGDVAMAQEQVQELSLAARQVYQDVREGILALRSQLGSGRNLQEVLSDYISEYELQLRRPVKVQWQLHYEDLALTPLQEVQLLRIVQEALTNIRKHAEATEVLVDFNDRDGALEIEIKDNGKGFNPLAIKRGQWPHLGLQTMQERAEAVGGVFELDSSPGKGTVVRVRVPYAVGSRATGATS